ncbi:MAG: hypothetical protein WCO55_01265 [Candidatus Falkowbacteria bacterium]
MNKKILSSSLYCALGTAVYIGLVSWLLANANHIFGQMTGVVAPITFLLLFVVSAAITASLVLGRPLMMYLDGAKKEAVKHLFATIAWLLILTIVFLGALVVRNIK